MQITNLITKKKWLVPYFIVLGQLAFSTLLSISWGFTLQVRHKSQTQILTGLFIAIPLPLGITSLLNVLDASL
jgi:hypothetical protein